MPVRQSGHLIRGHKIKIEDCFDFKNAAPAVVLAPHNQSLIGVRDS